MVGADLLAFFYWDPPRSLFQVPFLDSPLTYYGICFAVGCLLAYLLVQRAMKKQLLLWGIVDKRQLKERSVWLTDQLAWLAVLGVIIGARLFHVFFYDWDFFKEHPLQILMVWKGGLASHGAVVGLLMGLMIFRLRVAKAWPRFTFFSLLDILSLPALVTAAFIRLGNFFNQEIIGIQSQWPCAVIFGHPYDCSISQPCHPVQLYEMAYYLILFICLKFFKNRPFFQKKAGHMAGAVLVLVFTFRLFIENLKLPQSSVDEHVGGLFVGQYLSIPFILLGLWLLGRKQKQSLQPQG